MRATFDRNQNTCMVLIAAQFKGNRSQYVANVIEDPTLMEECMTRVGTHLASRESRYMTYCRLRLEHLLEENGRKLAAARSKERDAKILARVLLKSFDAFAKGGRGGSMQDLGSWRQAGMLKNIFKNDKK